ncbi:hypothetical protein ACU4GD_20850 [Cupriavidus basilensis]
MRQLQAKRTERGAQRYAPAPANANALIVAGNFQKLDEAHAPPSHADRPRRGQERSRRFGPAAVQACRRHAGAAGNALLPTPTAAISRAWPNPLAWAPQPAISR